MPVSIEELTRAYKQKKQVIAQNNIDLGVYQNNHEQLVSRILSKSKEVQAAIASVQDEEIRNFIQSVCPDFDKLKEHLDDDSISDFCNQWGNFENALNEFGMKLLGE